MLLNSPPDHTPPPHSCGLLPVSCPPVFGVTRPDHLTTPQIRLCNRLCIMSNADIELVLDNLPSNLLDRLPETVTIEQVKEIIRARDVNVIWPLLNLLSDNVVEEANAAISEMEKQKSIAEDLKNKLIWGGAAILGALFLFA